MKTILATALLLSLAIPACHTEQQTEPERVSASAGGSAQQPAATPSSQAPAEPIPSIAITGLGSCQPSSEVNSLATRAMALADADGNGQVSREEAESMVNLVLGGAFFRADQNGDGKVTAEEGRAARTSLLAQHPAVAALLTRARESTGVTPFKSLAQLLDANYGQTLSLAEARDAASTAVSDLFRIADRNADGTISRQEALIAANEGASAVGEKAFEAADANHDHFLSASEFEAAASGPLHAVFAMFDTNKDGKLTESEASAALNAAGLSMGAPRIANKQ